MESEQKKLYEHFIKTGKTAEAAAILKVYPQFKTKEEPVVKETKSKRRY